MVQAFVEIRGSKAVGRAGLPYHRIRFWADAVWPFSAFAPSDGCSRVWFFRQSAFGARPNTGCHSLKLFRAALSQW